MVEGEEEAKSDADMTMWAIMDPDAVYCMGPNGEEYDQPVITMELGYYEKIWDLPVDKGVLVNPPYIRSNGTDSGAIFPSKSLV